METTLKIKRTSNKSKSKGKSLSKAITRGTRITAEKLFSLFTADIINKNVTFTR